VLRSAAALIGGLVIGLIHSWKLTLVFMAFASFIVMSGFLEVTLMQGNAARDKEALEEAGKVCHVYFYSIKSNIISPNIQSLR